jgi:hypothetical protein
MSALAQDDAANAAPRYLEAPDDPPAPYRAVDDPGARTPGVRASVGPYVSVQVNVDSQGQNIVGDAANETSIAVDPNNPDNLVIGWRQFDNVLSNFRQAGRAYSFDAGASWTFPGVLTPGLFRSDPVLDTDNNGNVFYQSLQETFLMDVFTSTDGGATFGPPVFSYGGDKNWLAVDRSGGTGDGHLYGIWQRFFGCCGSNVLTRSIDGANSFEFPVGVTFSPTFGTMAVGPDGALYAAGIDGTFTQDFTQFVVSKSANAQNPAVPPTFTGQRVELGGNMVLGGGPNPDGLLGQANVAVDTGNGPTRGNVYLLASVNPPGGDPLDVHLIRSTDGGNTWSAPVRVNDDPAGNGAYQWFGAHSVAPDGRIDVIWNDTRNSGQTNVSELFYAWSYDEGRTWLGNEPVSPPFNSFVGWPNQNKLGDYYTIISDATGAGVAYAATFNNEQDAYYLRLFPDCNDNGISDVTDIIDGTSVDADGNGVPDECAAGNALILTGPQPGVTGQANAFTATQASPGGTVFFLRSFTAGQRTLPACGIDLGLGNPRLLGSATADATGVAVIERFIPIALSSRTVFFQAVQVSSCRLSNVIEYTFP